MKDNLAKFKERDVEPDDNYTLEPLTSRLLAKQYEADKVGNIIVPDTAKQVSLKATVVSVGPECVNVEVGDRIIFGRYGKFDVPLRGRKWKNHFIMNEDDILCKIKE